MATNLDCICILCIHSVSEPVSKHFPAATYCLMDVFTNDGKDNYPDIVSCEQFKIDPDLTVADLAWLPIASAAKEIDRLNIKLSVMELLTAPAPETGEEK